jgi:hypothetical protein
MLREKNLLSYLPSVWGAGMFLKNESVSPLRVVALLAKTNTSRIQCTELANPNGFFNYEPLSTSFFRKI